VVENLEIDGFKILPGSATTINIELPKLYTHSHTTMPLKVIRGKKSGPTLFVSAAIHGDEINGIEIIRRLLNYKGLNRLKGTLITIPIVNVYGVIQHSRYLPDRRDLNRSFPGSDTGSLAARLADLFMTEIVNKCTHGIDLHTGAVHRANFPQIRANIDDPETDRLARAFGVPVILNASIRDGSLRQSAADYGIPMLLYEAGEALRFDEVSIRAGVDGIIKVMRELGMLYPSKRKTKTVSEPFIARSSAWTRAPQSGVLRTLVALGAHVEKQQVLGVVSDPYGVNETEIQANTSGVIIGRTNLPLVNEGDALFHIARFGKAQGEVVKQIEEFNIDRIDAVVEGEEPIV